MNETPNKSQSPEPAGPFPSPRTPEQAVHLARQVALSLHQRVRCDGCDDALPRARPWRARSCGHLLCAQCALVTTSSGYCPVGSCGVPVCPADVVEDFGAWHVVDACAALAVWARRAPPSRWGSPAPLDAGTRGTVPAAAVLGEEGARSEHCARTGGVVISGDDLFEDNAQLGTL